MPEKAMYTVSANTPLAKDIYFMRLCGPTGSFTAPGQFVNIKIEGFYLRRPLSVCDWRADGLDLIYKVVGGGTRALSAVEPGAGLELLAGLGNGFDMAPVLAGPAAGVVLVGGGVGVPPLYGLCKRLVASSVCPTVALGFREADEAFLAAEFARLGCRVEVATQDGSLGQKGLVTDVLQNIDYDYYYTCGPLPMLRAVHDLGKEKGAEGQLSFEEKMGCGFGACMGCSCRTLAGTKRICVEGPVLSSKEVFA